LHIIPVIDLLNGVVVHAKQGARAQYRAIQSSLTSSSHPIDIVKSFMALYPFKTLYIADLNAIQKLANTGQSHQQILEEIHLLFPHLTLWIDAGINDDVEAQKWQKSYTQLVLGSESFTRLSQYQTLIATLNKSYVLSLDFLPQGYAGPTELLQDSQHWPKEVIVMTLKQVGANMGIDHIAVNAIVNKAQHHQIFAAGGIRGINDLSQLKKLYVHGALIASALHHLQLSSQDLVSLDAE